MNLALHYRRMTDDVGVLLCQKVKPAEGVLPVVLGKAAVLVLGECLEQQFADRGDFVSGQLGRGNSSKVRRRMIESPSRPGEWSGGAPVSVGDAAWNS